MGPLLKLLLRSAPESLGSKYLTKFEGPAQSGRVFTSKELNELRNQLAFYAKPRSLPPSHSDSLQMLLRQAEDPRVKTHVLYTGKDFTEPSAAFQLQSNSDLGFEGDYLPNLVSLLGLKGQGQQALQEARRGGAYGLVATPESRAFYEKMLGRLKGFEDYPDPDLKGVGYQYRRKGGLVQYKECSCGQ